MTDGNFISFHSSRSDVHCLQILCGLDSVVDNRSSHKVQKRRALKYIKSALLHQFRVPEESDWKRYCSSANKQATMLRRDRP
ncbi:hypothetical protein CEXT_552221 [Caerostris extrusa]|uniref:LAGLIDADG homing endonuclease n=1 Tax=Caerostris extrusa TaxID=172846 RepID=A0AAV4X7H6_CAEEX|nr:hypothetical protein CEXT_552221 [Caerostris extrusa]